MARYDGGASLMLDLQGVSKWFSGFRALNAVDLRVRPGEIVGLVGANGAGKSTLLKVLGGLYPDAQYSGTLGGQALDLSSPVAALRAGIGVVHQEIDLAPNLDVAENMLLGREPTRNALGLGIIRRKELQDRARHVLETFGFKDVRSDDRVDALSIEKRQIVQVARILALDAQVVVFDEPTARLSSEGRGRLFAVMDRLRQAGKMVLFVSHYLEEVLDIADRIVVLRDGRVAGESKAQDTDIPGLTQLMRGGLQVETVRRAVPPGALALVVKGLTAEPHFRDIGFEARASEVLGLTGIAGSGRQELVRSLIGERSASGSIMVAGAEIERASVAKVVGRFLGFVPEDRKLDGILLERSVNDNLSLPWLRNLSIAGIVDQTRIRPRAKALIARLGLVCSSGAQFAGQLSGGNQQKAVLGRWLGSGLPVVILESPTVGVDVAGKEEIRRLIRSLCEDGMAVVLSTEDHWELEQLSDRILVMVRGEIAQEFHTNTVSRAALVSKVSGYFGSNPRQIIL